MVNEDEPHRFSAGYGWQSGSEPHLDKRAVHPLAAVTEMRAPCIPQKHGRQVCTPPTKESTRSPADSSAAVDGPADAAAGKTDGQFPDSSRWRWRVHSDREGQSGAAGATGGSDQK
ncbi:hypothetical protein KFL_000150010 [Klebsormidium nitens]|uniref:Uncharacterized protein n=1 Tax=Klebsormidium nitens TaxID=105231 RepID=A0A1Y1HJ51_KLENI|nr:hypothetical protein KFL_000150010 [Klebsormidium nitens]|eukprot:GAQ78550.1 hypothetical protein KFL_000150010 [Klebsormidium nitens]